VILIKPSNCSLLISSLLCDFLIGLLDLNFHIKTFEGNKCCKSSFLDIVNIDSEAFKSIDSKANNSKSNLSIAFLDIVLLNLIVEMIV